MPVWALTLMAVLGLVQSGSFAAVPQLNASINDQALANGAMAQCGNLGNSLGTPLFLSLVAFGGTRAMYVAIIALCALALGQHLWQAARRNQLDGA